MYMGLNAGFKDVLPMCKVMGMYLVCLQNCVNWLLASSYLSVRPSAWNNSSPTGWIVVKFDL